MTEAQEKYDQAERKSVEKTSEKAAVSGVIGGQPNQEVHGAAHAAIHANDKTLSEPDMISMEENETVAAYKARVAQIQANRFGFYDSAQKNTSDASVASADKTKIHEHPAMQAVKPIPELSPTMRQPPFDSSVKANVQITNVPEVSESVTIEVLGMYAETVLENAADAVRQIESHLMTPNAINGDLQKIGQWISDAPEHFAQSPEQLNTDVQAITGAAIDEIDKPLMPEDRAKMAGMLLPLFFFEGGKEPINPETIEQMGLKGMSETELKALGIEKRVEALEEGIADKRRVLEEKDIVNPINRRASVEEKIAQLEALSRENKPLVEKFLRQIDTRFGTKSEVSFKAPEDIVEKANRPSIKDSKEWFDIEHVRDSLRFKTSVQDLNELPALAQALKDAGFVVVKSDLDKLITPKARGWLVGAVDVRAPNGQVLEYQILPEELNTAGKLEHQHYKNVRSKDIMALSDAQYLEYLDVNRKAQNLYSDAWKAYLQRTGQSEEAVQKFVDAANEILSK